MSVGFGTPLFEDEGSAAVYIENIRWPNGPVCPFCHESLNIRRDEDQTSIGHSCPTCTKSFTVVTGTMIERSALPLTKWLSTFQALSRNPEKPLDTILRGIFHPIDPDPDIQLLVDGRTMEPDTVDGLVYSFFISETPSNIQILSRHFIPAMRVPASTDRRRLGIGIKSIVINTSDATFEWSHDDPALTEGFHSQEPGQRWTNGRAVVPVQYFSELKDRFTFIINLSHRNGLYSAD